MTTRRTCQRVTDQRPSTEERITSQAREVVQQHMEAVYAADLDEVIAGYTDDAMLFDARGAHRGHAAIREVFAEALRWASDFQPELEIEEAENVVFVTWTAQRAGQADLAGSDTFVIEGGRIAVHTGFIVEAAPMDDASTPDSTDEKQTD